jgi:hypothetical protein
MGHQEMSNSWTLWPTYIYLIKIYGLLRVYGELVYFNTTKNTFQIHVCNICLATHAGVYDSLQSQETGCKILLVNNP